MSRSLAKLRAWFGDPLLTRTRTGMAPTAMGVLLAAEVRIVVDRIQSFVDRRESFEPATAARTFRLTMSDYPQHVVCGPLLAHLMQHAPGIDVEVRPWSLDFPEALEAGALDAVVSPPITAVSGLRSTELVSDELVLVLRRDHPLAQKQRLTIDDHCALWHIQAAEGAAGRQRTAVHRRPTATARGKGQGARPSRSRGRSLDRDARHILRWYRVRSAATP